MKETIAIVLFGSSCIVILCASISLIRSERRHRRFKAVLADADKAIDAIRGGKTMRDVRARAERADEILELAGAIKDE